MAGNSAADPISIFKASRRDVVILFPKTTLMLPTERDDER
jgi:hypothetical protein